MLTRAGFEIYDTRTFKRVEGEPFDAWTLVSPVLSHTTNGTITYSDAVSEVAHSVRVYKGKIFLLVSSCSPVMLCDAYRPRMACRDNMAFRLGLCSHGPIGFYTLWRTETF